MFTDWAIILFLSPGGSVPQGFPFPQEGETKTKDSPQSDQEKGQGREGTERGQKETKG